MKLGWVVWVREQGGMEWGLGGCGLGAWVGLGGWVERSWADGWLGWVW